MNYQLVFTHSYNKRARKFLDKNPNLLPQYEKTLRILEVDPFHPALRMHKLSGKLGELRSVSINISYRITLEFLVSESRIILVNVGRHEDVY